MKTVLIIMPVTKPLILGKASPKDQFGELSAGCSLEGVRLSVTSPRRVDLETFHPDFCIRGNKDYNLCFNFLLGTEQNVVLETSKNPISKLTVSWTTSNSITHQRTCFLE